MQNITGSICAPKGFKAAGIAAGIKAKNTKKDLALIVSDTPAIAAGVFTTNIVQAAPIVVTKNHIASGEIQAVIINSGNANACTGQQGLADAKLMCELTAEQLQIDTKKVAVSSTGVIGVTMPMEKVTAGIKKITSELNVNSDHEAALAIMTTDTFPKEIAIQFEIAGTPIRIGGIAKGSGMIHPNMATTLGFITTDANIAHNALQMALQNAIANSFNMISVDGDTSTNDMVLILANGQANNPQITLDKTSFEQFSIALQYVLTYLAKEVARDGEGATKIFEMQVHGAPSIEDARKAALAVCKSSLVKTAIFGRDANWGRILCALGYSGANFDPNKVDLFIGDVPVMLQGAGLAFDEAAAAKILNEKEIVIKAHLNSGEENATAWGCDLSYDYVKINGSYRS